jgi:membrane protein
MIVSARDIGSGIIGTTVGVIAFLVLATGAFVEIQDSLNLIWKVPSVQRRRLGLSSATAS